MTELRSKNLIRKILSNIPILLLFISVLNDFDFNHLGLKYFSFIFSYILIFYYSLKKSESLGYIYIFIAGLFNDVVMGTFGAKHTNTIDFQIKNDCNQIVEEDVCQVLEYCVWNNNTCNYTN